MLGAVPVWAICRPAENGPEMSSNRRARFPLHPPPPTLTCDFTRRTGTVMEGFPLTVEGSGVQWSAMAEPGGLGRPQGTVLRRGGGGCRVSRHPHSLAGRQGAADPSGEVPG